jgi:hypothetical protein
MHTVDVGASLVSGNVTYYRESRSFFTAQTRLNLTTSVCASENTMAEIAGSTLSLLSIVQSFIQATSSMREEERNAPLRKISLYMSVLKDDLAFVDTIEDSEFSTSIQAAMQECAILGKELSYQSDKFSTKRGRVIFVLAARDTLEALYTDFRDSVTLLHNLIQRYLHSAPFSFPGSGV